MIDMHVHSSASDGSLPPAEVVSLAAEAGLEAIALTDHDTVSGVAEAIEAGRRLGVEVVPGIEFSVKGDRDAGQPGETHILGFFLDHQNEKLLSALRDVQLGRQNRCRDVARRLAEAGIDVTFEEAREQSGGDQVGRAHFAAVMVRKGIVTSVKQAFDLYLGAGKVGYSPLHTITAKQAISLINGAGGAAYVAHLHQTKMDMPRLSGYIADLKTAGLSGIEGMHSEYTSLMQEQYGALSDELDLLRCGGSDFHGAVKPDIELGKGRGNLEIPRRYLEDARAAAEAIRAAK